MGRTLRTNITVEASAERVWEVLTDFASYPRWNPFITSISGDLRPGSRLRVSLQPPGGRGITLRPTVLAAAPGKELRWKGRLLAPGIFDGEHRFTIEERAGDEVVTFVQGEVFSGALVPLTGRLLERTEAGFERMNQALRDRAEATTR